MDHIFLKFVQRRKGRRPSRSRRREVGVRVRWAGIEEGISAQREKVREDVLIFSLKFVNSNLTRASTTTKKIKINLS
jgi:hypothetical protein